jgi:hypothetical protein
VLEIDVDPEVESRLFTCESVSRSHGPLPLLVPGAKFVRVQAVLRFLGERASGTRT